MGSAEIAKLLIEKGASVNTRYDIINYWLTTLKFNNQGVSNITPLQIACKINAFNTAKLLIDKGADISAKDNNVTTDNHMAFTTRSYSFHSSTSCLLVRCCWNSKTLN